MSHNVGHMDDSVSHMIVCDACGRGPSARVYVMPRWVTKIRSERETLVWARAAGRRIGLELRSEIEAEQRALDRRHDEEYSKRNVL